MYEDFFGLNEKPFSIQPDPAFLYWGRGHRLAYAMLEYGVLNHAGISVVTGEVGCGKTTLIHRLLDQLSDTHSVALLSNVQQGRGDLLSWVLMGFGQSFAGKSHVELFSQLQSFFIREYAKGRRVVLIIDEAQNLSQDMLEELRLLSNINAGKDQLLQLILVGQPQLKDILNHPDMLQLAQRVGSDFHLNPLSAEEVDAYIDTRLGVAGARRRIFTERAVRLVAEQSGGVPRVINIIADTALVYAFSAQDQFVDEDTIRNVIRDKAEYGVFGLPRTTGPAAPRAPVGGPEAFVKERPGASPSDGEGAKPADDLREESVSLRARAHEDAPRMSAGGVRRRREPAPVSGPVRDGSPASAATGDKPTLRRHAEEEAAPARQSSAVAVETRERPFPDAPQDASSFNAETIMAEAPAVARDVEVESAFDEVMAEPGPEPEPEVEVFDDAEELHAEALNVGVVIIGAAADPERTIVSAGDATGVVYVARSTDDPGIERARAAGAEVVAIADRALSPGRARNAGYRQLKRELADLDYVQFIEAGDELATGWLETACEFMERRPEVAAVEGEISERRARGSAFNSAAERGAEGRAGEIQTTANAALIRAEAFEAAGGFRGDLPVNETRDLCIRLRRRGAHIWRLDAPMVLRDSGLDSFGAWWARAALTGYEYAHGAALHGGWPENLFAREEFRASLWGAVAPIFIVAGAVAAGFAAAAFTPRLDPWLAGLAVVVAGALLYLVRIILIAIRRGPFRASSWTYAAVSTAAHAPEVVGVWRFHFGGPQPGRPRRAAA